MSMIYCRGCGQQIHITAPACPHCGAPNASAQPQCTIPGGTVATDIPPGVAGWSWGAFLLNWIWAIGNRTWIGLLCLIPIIGTIMAFVLGFKGREWAWKNAKWDSVEHFNKVQRRWSIWALVLVLGFGVIGILAAIALPAYQDYTTRAKTSEVIISMAPVRTALTERISNPANTGILSPEEARAIASSAAPSAQVSEVDVYAWDQYADVVSEASIGSVSGRIYMYTRDGGKTWACGSEQFPAKFLPQSCRETGGLDRPQPPKPQPMFGLWKQDFAEAFNANCVASASKVNPDSAIAYCECMASQLADAIPQDAFQASTQSAEVSSVIESTREICTQRL